MAERERIAKWGSFLTQEFKEGAGGGEWQHYRAMNSPHLTRETEKAAARKSE